jgi:cyclin H
VSQPLQLCVLIGDNTDYACVDSFISKFGKDRPEEILAGEFLLCQGLRFAFDAKHPFRALKGATMELRRFGDIEVPSRRQFPVSISSC